jgi:hypothetical protein
MKDLTVAIIGSFRQFYSDEVAPVIEVFEAARIPVLSPPKSTVRDRTKPFVRFASDPDETEATDYELQERALERILSASFVYVVAPRGYIGRTTLLEFGQIRERRIPAFFSAIPDDLPVRIEKSAVVAARDLVRRIAAEGESALVGGHLQQRSGGPPRCGSCRA